MYIFLLPHVYRFYPHHYAPFISDVTDFKDLEIKFDMGSPFLPFQQLMAVLPAASKELLPEPYQVSLLGLMDNIIKSCQLRS